MIRYPLQVFGFLLTSCVAQSHGYVRAAAHDEDGYHAQALLLQPLPAGLTLEQLLDVQTIDQDAFEGYISETHVLCPLGGGWSVLVYYRADSFFAHEWEARGGAGVQLQW